MIENEIAVFDSLICREPMGTLTSRRVCGYFQTNNKPLYIIHPVEYNKENKDILYPLMPATEGVIVYNSCEHKNKNISGLVVSVNNHHSSVILSGDCRYNQLASILPKLYYAHEHYLIVPHHGGKAGTYTYPLPLVVTPKEAIISVGKNNYGHPLDSTIDFLTRKKFKVRRTDREKGDLGIEL